MQSVRSNQSLGATLLGVVALVGIVAGATAYAQTATPNPTN